MRAHRGRHAACPSQADVADYGGHKREQMPTAVRCAGAAFAAFCRAAPNESDDAGRLAAIPASIARGEGAGRRLLERGVLPAVEAQVMQQIRQLKQGCPPKSGFARSLGGSGAARARGGEDHGCRATCGSCLLPRRGWSREYHRTFLSFDEAGQSENG